MPHSETPELMLCSSCGEEYSATLSRCPACGAKATPADPDEPPAFQKSARVPLYYESNCTFEEIPVSIQSKPRTPSKKAPRPINWMRVVTHVFSLVLLASALMIFFCHIYPNIYNGSNPDSGQAQPNANESGEQPNTPAPELDYIPGTTTEIATGITLDQTDFTLATNEVYSLTATVSPGNWIGTIIWTTSNPNIATVSADGTVTNVNVSSQLLSVTITATASEGISASVKIYCRGGSNPADDTTPENSNTSNLKLNREDFTLVLGKSNPFTMEVTSGPTNVIWSISDSSVATIDENGTVTAVGKGKATVTATAHDGSTATCIVRVRTS